MLRIYKYGLGDWASVDYVELDMPYSAKIIHVGHQKGEIMLWAEFDDQTTKLSKRWFKVLPTGASIQNHDTRMCHIGTVQINMSLTELVWHVYELDQVGSKS